MLAISLAAHDAPGVWHDCECNHSGHHFLARFLPSKPRPHHCHIRPCHHCPEGWCSQVHVPNSRHSAGAGETCFAGIAAKLVLCSKACSAAPLTACHSQQGCSDVLGSCMLMSDFLHSLHRKLHGGKRTLPGLPSCVTISNPWTESMQKAH